MSSESDSDSSVSSSSRYSSSSSASSSSSESAQNSPEEGTDKRYKCTICRRTSSDIRGNVVVHIRLKHFGLPSTYKAQREQGIKDDRDAHAFIEDTYVPARKRKRDVAILTKRRDSAKKAKMANKFNVLKGARKMKMLRDKEQKSAKILKRPKAVIDSSSGGVAKPKENQSNSKLSKSKPPEKLTKSKSVATSKKCQFDMSKRSIQLLVSRDRMLSNPYTCPFNDCLEQLSSLMKWKIHIREHLDIRPFCCIWKHCKFTSSAKSQVYSHVRVKHLKLPRCQKVQQRKQIVEVREALDHVRTEKCVLDCLLPRQEIYEPWLLKYMNPSKKN